MNFDAPLLRGFCLPVKWRKQCLVCLWDNSYFVAMVQCFTYLFESMVTIFVVYLGNKIIKINRHHMKYQTC